jgi:acetyltransferase-like isoleucine patch superfamily enzyme
VGDSVEELRVVANTEVGKGTEIAEFSVLVDCVVGENCKIWRFANLYGCEIGDDCMVGSFVEIQEDVTVGDRCHIQTHAFLASMVTIADDVFVSHGAKFVNDRNPPRSRKHWESTKVGSGTAIGTNATILPVEIGENALIGAGTVVTSDVPDNAIVVGNPSEVIGYRGD